MELGLIFIICCFIFSITAAIKCKLPIFSTHSYLLLFCALYTAMPYLASIDIYPKTVWLSSLSQRKDLLNIHFFVVGLCVISFTITYVNTIGTFFHNKAIKHHLITKIGKLNKSEYMVFILISFLMIFVGSIGAFYPWSPRRLELTNSILSQSKVVVSGVFCYFFAKFGFSRYTIAIVSMFILVAIFEGSRTSLVSIFIAMLIFNGRNLSTKQTIKLIFVFALGLIGIIFIALNRVKVDLSNINLYDATFPIYIEGMYGSYMCLQAYDSMLISGVMAPTFGLNYFIDPIIYLVPRFVFYIFGAEKDSFNFFGQWIERVNTSGLNEKFAPYGGFFYPAEAFVALPFLGPVIVSGLFGLLVGYLELKSANGFWGRFWYINFLVGFFMVFIKHPFIGSTHFFVTTALSSLSVVYFVKFMNKAFCARD